MSKKKLDSGPDETRNNILDVALQEFAEKGLAGARIDEIAEKTATSKRMIYYYFKGKDELYRAVLERSYQNIREREAQAQLDALPPVEALRTHILQTFDYHAANPEFVRLVMNENIHHGQHIGHIDGIKDRNKSVIAALTALINRGVVEGVFRDGLDPTGLHMTITALSFYNVSNRDTFLNNFGVDMAAPAFLAARREEICAIILAWAGVKA